MATIIYATTLVMGFWSLQTEGGVRVLSDRCYANHGKDMYEVVISVARLRARKQSRGENPDCDCLRFALANLVLRGRYTKPPQPNPIPFSFQDSSLTIKPVEDYPDRIARLQSVGGVEYTADIIIRPHGKDMKSLDEAAALMEDLIPVLRLWSGNKLNWLYGKGYDYGGRLSEVLHQSPVVSGYADIAFYRGWSTHLPNFPSVNLCELAASDFPRQVRVLSDQNIREHIDGFVDACRTSQFRETKGNRCCYSFGCVICAVCKE